MIIDVAAGGEVAGDPEAGWRDPWLVELVLEKSGVQHLDTFWYSQHWRSWLEIYSASRINKFPRESFGFGVGARPNSTRLETKNKQSSKVLGLRKGVFSVQLGLDWAEPFCLYTVLDRTMLSWAFIACLFTSESVLDRVYESYRSPLYNFRVLGTTGNKQPTTAQICCNPASSVPGPARQHSSVKDGGRVFLFVFIVRVNDSISFVKYFHLVCWERTQYLKFLDSTSIQT